MDVYFILWGYHLILSLYFIQIVQAFALGTLSGWLPCPFDYKICQAILYFPCLDPRISHFSKEPSFLLLEKGIEEPRFGH